MLYETPCKLANDVHVFELYFKLHAQVSFNIHVKLKPGSHMSPMIGEALSVTIQGENSQRILLMSSHK